MSNRRTPKHPWLAFRPSRLPHPLSMRGAQGRRELAAIRAGQVSVVLDETHGFTTTNHERD